MTAERDEYRTAEQNAATDDRRLRFSDLRTLARAPLAVER